MAAKVTNSSTKTAIIQNNTQVSESLNTHPTPGILIDKDEMSKETRERLERYQALRRIDGVKLTIPAAVLELIEKGLTLSKI